MEAINLLQRKEAMKKLRKETKRLNKQRKKIRYKKALLLKCTKYRFRFVQYVFYLWSKYFDIFLSLIFISGLFYVCGMSINVLKFDENSIFIGILSELFIWFGDFSCFMLFTFILIILPFLYVQKYVLLSDIFNFYEDLKGSIRAIDSNIVDVEKKIFRNEKECKQIEGEAHK
ncbi:hypothetical protein P0E66_10345 [Enterococcus faecalis]|uniref:hypothetical protein n=1 Tax=Enterococcus faecalis TaxID=1351 RepID=UPI0025B25688|nr:hypothetical protein [Enterococcus faecalis]MDN3201523.1 hypothetical protein [Enterococcus faecalis]